MNPYDFLTWYWRRIHDVSLATSQQSNLFEVLAYTFAQILIENDSVFISPDCRYTRNGHRYGILNHNTINPCLPEEWEEFTIRF